jgi:hypothetical protein
LFCGTRLLVVSPESQNFFLPIPHPITPRNGHWSLYFRVLIFLVNTILQCGVGFKISLI